MRGRHHSYLDAVDEIENDTITPLMIHDMGLVFVHWRWRIGDPCTLHSFNHSVDSAMPVMPPPKSPAQRTLSSSFLSGSGAAPSASSADVAPGHSR